MPNNIILTEVTGDPMKWRVSYDVDAAGIKGRTLNTHNTFVDRDIDVVITTPAATFTTSVNSISVSQAGFIDQGTVVGTIPPASVRSGSATISTATFAYNSTNNNFDITGGTTVAAPSVVTAGYISSSIGTRTTNTAQLITTTSKIIGNISISGTATVKPTISKQDVPSGVTNAATTDAATTTAPSSGVYVAIKSAASTNTLTLTPNVTSAGYGTSAHHGITGTTKSVGADASDITYVKIKTTTMNQGTSVLNANGETVIRAKATWGSGWITSGEINAATFANTGTSQVSYLDISNTSDAPILVSGDYLYINKGYTDNLKISLAKLVPDSAMVGAATASNQMLSGFSAYNINGEIVTGSILSKSAETFNVQLNNDRTISAGQYLSGAQLIRGLVTSGINAGNIKYGAQIKVGDTGNATRIHSITGIFTGANTVQSGTAASAAYIVEGYSGWLNGEEIHGELDADALKTAAASVTGTTTATAPTLTRTNTPGTGTSINVGSAAATTSVPSSGYFVTAQPTAPATTISLTKTITTNGLLNNINQITASAKTTTKTGSIYFIPIKSGSCTVAGGELTTTNYTKNDLSLTLAAVSGETNLDTSVINLGNKNTATYPYYFKIQGATPSISGSVSATVTAITDTHTEGYISTTSSTIRDVQLASPTINISSASATSYINLKKASMTVAGTNTVTPSVALNPSNNVVLSDTNNGISVTGTGGGSASVTATATTNQAGYAPANTQLGSQPLSASTTTTTLTKFITKITVPKTTGFELETETGASSATEDQNIITITNKPHRNVSITADAGGWVNINHPTTNGTDRIDAFLSDGTTKSGVQSIVTGGKWKINNITPDPTSQLGPYYGATYIKAMSAGTTANITTEARVTIAPIVTIGGSTNMTTASSGTYYFTRTGTAIDGSVTPKWKNSVAGYAALNTAGTDGSSIPVTPTKTADATIYIPTTTGTVTMTPGVGICSYTTAINAVVNTSTGDPGSGVCVTFTGSGKVSATVGVTAGYTPKNTSFATGPSTTSQTKNTTAWITGVTLTKGKTFSITVPNGALNSDGTNNSTVTFVFTVANDNTGNVTIMGPD